MNGAENWGTGKGSRNEWGRELVSREPCRELASREPGTGNVESNRMGLGSWLEGGTMKGDDIAQRLLS
jgi:hypothetical protein